MGKGGDNINAIAVTEHEHSVIVYPIRCPSKECRSRNVNRYKTTLPIRYYRCGDCGNNFKTIESKELPKTGNEYLDKI